MTRAARRARKLDVNEEPVAEGEDWVERGGELIFAVCYTSWGFPYGSTEEQFREANMRYEHRRGWARAKSALYEALSTEAPPSSAVQVGYVKSLGSGIDHHAFHAEVEVDPDPSDLTGRYVALVPFEGNEEQRVRARREASVLRLLARTSLRFDTPRVVGAIDEESGGTILVETRVSGVPLDLRAGRQRRIRPWEVVGEIAAAVHAIDPAPFADHVPNGPSRQTDARDALVSASEGLDDPLVKEAKAWGLENLPPDEPCSLLHGDLLGQNILLPLLDPDDPVAVIDWNRARIGDPAHELAIVTRGVRRPFQIERGLARLLDAYSANGGQDITAAQVHLHELCLAMCWYRDSLDPKLRSHPPEQELNRLRGILRRATSLGS